MSLGKLQHKKSLLITSFSQMDLRLLSVLLDDDKTYSGAEKEIFLEKIHEKFEQLRSYGDEQLSVHQGHCSSKDGQNTGYISYAFLGDISGCYLAIIIKEKDDDISDIIQCEHFESTAIWTYHQIFYSFKDDELISFRPDLAYLIKSQCCQKALDEIYYQGTPWLNKEVYIPWLERYEALQKSVSGIYNWYAAYEEFSSIYFELGYLKSFLDSSKLAEQAMEEYRHIDQEANLGEWLTRYESLGIDLVYFSGLRWEYDESAIIFPISIHDIQIYPMDFEHLLTFNFHFSRHYYKDT